MYTRYVRGSDGIYRLQEDLDTVSTSVPEPECSASIPQAEQPLEDTVMQIPQKEPGLLNALLSRQFDADDLLLAAIVLLLLIDGGEEDWLAMLAALAFLFF